MCASVCVCHMCASFCRGQKRAQNPLKESYDVSAGGQILEEEEAVLTTEPTLQPFVSSFLGQLL